MDQLQDFLTYKHFFELKNITTGSGHHMNLTLAEQIVADFENNLITVHHFTTVILLTLYIPIFLVGLFGNLLIIVSVSADKVKKAKLYFLVNLALADLAVTVFCMPTSIGTNVYRLWVYGQFLCKFSAFIQGVAVAVTIFTMTAMALDRYVSLQHPAAYHRISTPNQALILIICMWIVAAIFMGPLVYIRDIDIPVNVPFLPPLPFCIEKWPHDRDRQAYGVFLLFVVFIIPAFTIGICYGHIGKALFVTNIERVNSDGSTQRLVYRQRAARMVFLLVCAFMVCWLPYSIISALADLSESASTVKALPFVLWLGHAHSAVNPAMYWSLNRQFRVNVRRLMKSLKKKSCTSTGDSTVALPQFV